MKFQWLTTGAAVALVVLPAAASPARRAPSLFNDDNTHHGSKLRKNNVASAQGHGDTERDYRLSVPPAETETGVVTEEVTVTTTTTVTSVPSSSAGSSASSSASSRSSYLYSSSASSSSSTSTSTSTANAVSGTSSSCESLLPLLSP